VNLKRLIHGLVPPVAWRLRQRYIHRCGYFGSYRSWEDAQRHATGYDAQSILEKVRDSLLRVKRGEAAYERDSVNFDEVHYCWPLLAGLLWIASSCGNRLDLLDFGGSLGSSFFQNRKFLSHLEELRWSIVEQENFVRCGQDYFADGNLKFYYTVDDCIREQRPDAVLLSSVLPYLESPYDLLSDILSRGFTYVMIDRTPLLDRSDDRLTVQQVPSEIYKASYPAWILGRKKLLDMFSRDYELIVEFDALAGDVFLGDAVARDTGMIFRIKECK